MKIDEMPKAWRKMAEVKYFFSEDGQYCDKDS